MRTRPALRAIQRALPAILLAVIAGCGGDGDGDVDVGEVLNYTVTALAGDGGSVAPLNASVASSATASFTLTPDNGFVVDSVVGCGGDLQGTTYTTGPITAPCSLAATFRRPFVSGSVAPAAGSALDRDVNDRTAPYASNDSLATAQLIPNPVTVGGYVNEPETGPQGRSFATGDEYDIFRTGLLAGQTVTLWIASPDPADDLDLILVDMDATIVDASVDANARVESLTVPEGGDGEYFIVVHAWSGASNYLLTIGQADATATVSARLSDDFVPRQALVRFVDTPGPDMNLLARQAAMLGWNRGRESELRERNALLDFDVLATMGSGDIASRVAARPHVDRLGIGHRVHMRGAEDAEKLATLYAIKELYRDVSVDAAAPNLLYELESGFMPNDQYYGHQWHYPQISLPNAWELSTGDNAIVAVVDSGVLLDHPDLQGQLLPGYDFVLGSPGGNDPGASPPPPGGSLFHGTHVAGTVAAATHNGFGVAGVAFGARILPLRVCSNTSCSGYAIEQAVRYAAGLPNDSGSVPVAPAHVINLSLGRSGPYLQLEQDLYDVARMAGVVVVAAAGNENTSAAAYPAAYGGVLAVSAVDFGMQKTYYSNFGSWIDVAAPGGDLTRDLNADGFPDGVLSTHADDRDGRLSYIYRFLQGTSMAVPHVAGVIALMRAVAPELTPADVAALLQNGALTDDLGVPGKDDLYGHGLINAYKAVVASINTAGGSVELEPLLAASATTVSFGAMLEHLQVTLTNVGGGSLTLGQPTENSGGWLALATATQGDSTVFTLSVDRDGLADGVYIATATFPSSANTVEVGVLMQVADLKAGEVGPQYVLLIDPDNFETRYSMTAEALEDDTYAFRIDDVEAGSYLLISGSDHNNDFFICDDGESCGVYGSFGEPVLIEIDGADLEGLDFVSGYHPRLPGVQAVGWLRSGLDNGARR
jgi:serine protease